MARGGDTSENGKLRQILNLKAVHLLAFFILVYVGVEVTVGSAFDFPPKHSFCLADHRPRLDRHVCHSRSWRRAIFWVSINAWVVRLCSTPPFRYISSGFFGGRHVSVMAQQNVESLPYRSHARPDRALVGKPQGMQPVNSCTHWPDVF
jgi:hypothetical protein